VYEVSTVFFFVLVGAQELFFRTEVDMVLATFDVTDDRHGDFILFEAECEDDDTDFILEDVRLLTGHFVEVVDRDVDDDHDFTVLGADDVALLLVTVLLFETAVDEDEECVLLVDAVLLVEDALAMPLELSVLELLLWGMDEDRERISLLQLPWATTAFVSSVTAALRA
jgi:hypothetical protein